MKKKIKKTKKKLKRLYKKKNRLQNSKFYNLLQLNKFYNLRKNNQVVKPMLIRCFNYNNNKFFNYKILCNLY